MNSGSLHGCRSKFYSNDGNKALLAQIEGVNCQILDIGCGDGTNARILNSRGHVIDGITLSEMEAKACETVMRTVIVHDLESGLPALKSKYDYVICSHVLEHIAYPEKLLHDIADVLLPNGKLVIALPNIMHYSSRLRIFMGEFKYENSGVWDYTHLRWYTFKSAKKLLELHHYKVDKSLVDGELPFLRLTRTLPKSLRRQLYVVLSSISKGLFGGQLIYVARTKGHKHLVSEGSKV